MFTLITAFRHVRERYWPQRDRGETGPLGYAVMVSAIVILAVAVAAWGADVADFFMDELAEYGGDGGGADPGGGGT